MIITVLSYLRHRTLGAHCRSGLRSSFVLPTTRRIGYFALERLFHDQTHRLAHQRPLDVLDFALTLEELLQALARRRTCRYPLHRVAPFRLDSALTESRSRL